MRTSRKKRGHAMRLGWVQAVPAIWLIGPDGRVVTEPARPRHSHRRRQGPGPPLTQGRPSAFSNEILLFLKALLIL